MTGPFHGIPSIPGKYLCTGLMQDSIRARFRPESCGLNLVGHRWVIAEGRGQPGLVESGTQVNQADTPALTSLR